MPLKYVRNNKRGPKHIINERIREKELRVIHGKENLGVITKEEALKIAKDNELDLVLIAPQANPPVAKILDYNKFLYAENKKQSAARSKAKKSELKEFKMRPTTGSGDIKRYVDRAKEFIKSGNRVKMSVVMRGRENSFPQVAFDKLGETAEELRDVARMEDEKPKRTGSTIWVVFVSK
ncbi:translation initiation factor IF-3 [Patescibacteria group bacterium]|nr:translation initiation factor IF-3 [Patescibacteria group bacterium]